MAYSKIDICNLALAMLGEDSIRSFDDHNKRARLCSNLFDFSRDSILIKAAWTFAVKFFKLKKLDGIASDEQPPDISIYNMPNDCLKPLDITPFGSKQKWYVCAEGIAVSSSVEEPTLKYIKKDVDVGSYTLPFISILSAKIAMHLALPVTKSQKIAGDTKKLYYAALAENIPDDDNIGDNGKSPDNEPWRDTFVEVGQ